MIKHKTVKFFSIIEFTTKQLTGFFNILVYKKNRMRVSSQFLFCMKLKWLIKINFHETCVYLLALCLYMTLKIDPSSVTRLRTLPAIISNYKLEGFSSKLSSEPKSLAQQFRHVTKFSQSQNHFIIIFFFILI